MSCKLHWNLGIYWNRCKWRKGRHFLPFWTWCQVHIGGSHHILLQMNLKPPKRWVQTIGTGLSHKMPMVTWKTMRYPNWSAGVHSLTCQPQGEVSTRTMYSPHETFWLSRHFHLRYFGHKHPLPRECPQVSNHLLPRNTFPAEAFPHGLEPDISPPCPPGSWHRHLIVSPRCLSLLVPRTLPCLPSWITERQTACPKLFRHTHSEPFPHTRWFSQLK